MWYLGIDQHRKQLTANLRNEEGEVVLKRQLLRLTVWSVLLSATRCSRLPRC